MELKYFKFINDFSIKLPDNIHVIVKKDSIFHIQSQYRSPVTGDEMVVVAIDKCTPIAVPISAGIMLD